VIIDVSSRSGRECLNATDVVGRWQPRLKNLPARFNGWSEFDRTSTKERKRKVTYEKCKKNVHYVCWIGSAAVACAAGYKNIRSKHGNHTRELQRWSVIE
jgi:hypothetical protein